MIATFPGRLITEDAAGHQCAVPKTWTIDEIREAVLGGGIGMISLSWYFIGGRHYKASALTIGAGYGVPEGVNRTVQVHTHFRREHLGEPYRHAGDPTDMVPVDVLINPVDIEYVSIMVRSGTTPEWCGYCNSEMELKRTFEAQQCPKLSRKGYCLARSATTREGTNPVTRVRWHKCFT